MLNEDILVTFGLVWSGRSDPLSIYYVSLFTVLTATPYTVIIMRINWLVQHVPALVVVHE